MVQTISASFTAQCSAPFELSEPSWYGEALLWMERHVSAESTHAEQVLAWRRACYATVQTWRDFEGEIPLEELLDGVRKEAERTMKRSIPPIRIPAKRRSRGVWDMDALAGSLPMEDDDDDHVATGESRAAKRRKADNADERRGGGSRRRRARKSDRFRTVPVREPEVDLLARCFAGFSVAPGPSASQPPSGPKPACFDSDMQVNEDDASAKVATPFSFSDFAVEHAKMLEEPKYEPPADLEYSSIDPYLVIPEPSRLNVRTYTREEILEQRYCEEDLAYLRRVCSSYLREAVGLSPEYDAY